MSSLNPVEQEPESLQSGIYLASGIVPNISGCGPISIISGNLVVLSGQVALLSGSIGILSGNVYVMSGQVSVSGLYTSAVLESGAGGISGITAAGIFGYDYSGAVWRPIPMGISGNQTTLNVTSTLASGAYLASGINFIQASGIPTAISGQTLTQASGAYLASGLNYIVQSGVYLASGIYGGPTSIVSGVSVLSGSVTVNSGQVAVSGLFAGGVMTASVVSGAISVASGAIGLYSGVYLASGISINISGQATSMSGNYVNMSGLFILPGAGAVLESGIGRVSGTIGVSILGWDLSGGTWNPLAVQTSGSNILNVNANVTIASGLWLASGIVPNISGQAVEISGNPVYPGVSGYMAAGAGWSGTLLMPSVYIPQYKRSMYLGISGLYDSAASSLGNGSAAAGSGFALTSAVTNTVTIRNLSGNAPIFVGFSGYWPSSGGHGFPLYGGDGLTLDTGPNMNLVYVVAVTSGTQISHFGTVF